MAIALVLAGTIGLGILYCLMVTPRYSSTATLQVKPEDHDSSGSPQSTFNADELKSEIETDISGIQSDGMAVAVIETLGLADKRPFRSAVNPSEKGRSLKALQRPESAWLACSSVMSRLFDSPKPTRD